MNINWNKWILEWLPFSLRTCRMYVFCLLMTLPVRVLYSSFSVWSRKMRNRAGGTPQVCMLKKVIYDELGINIEIEEGNGKPYDFIITTAFSDVDKERQLFALLDRYKLAGKSYGYANAEVLLNYEWGGYVCEAQTSFVTWGGFVCEIKNRPVYYFICHFDGQNISVELPEPLGSDMNVNIYRQDYDHETGGAINTYEVTFEFKKGDTGVFKKYFPYAYHMMTDVIISKREDETYIYKYKVV